MAINDGGDVRRRRSSRWVCAWRRRRLLDVSVGGPACVAHARPDESVNDGREWSGAVVGWSPSRLPAAVHAGAWSLALHCGRWR
jgi:hypothetical protein